MKVVYIIVTLRNTGE